MPPPKPTIENDSLKKAFLTTSVALYLQACHLQYEEEADAVMLSFLLANAGTGQSGNTPGNQPGSGKAGLGKAGNGGDDDDSADDETNLGGSLVNNTGPIPSDADSIDAGRAGVPSKEKESSRQAAEEDVAATSPGGTGESRIIGGVNPGDDNIDWNDAIDEGTKDADAATG